MINSYNNQNDTLSNNINYLKYFYHLFPTHVKMFYSLFQALINPHIDIIKSLILGLYCCSIKIPSYFSILSRFLATISPYQTSVDLRVLVQQHKSALNNLINQIRQKLCDDIKHIEDVLDNVTGNKEKSLTGIIDKIYNDLLKESQSIKYTYGWLSFLLHRMLRLFIDGIHSKLSIDTGYYAKNLQWYYYSYEEKLSSIRDMISSPAKEKGKPVAGSYIRTGVRIEAIYTSYFKKYDKALTEIERGKRGIKGISYNLDEIKSSCTLMKKVRKSLEDVISELGRDVKFSKEIASYQIRQYISTLEESVERLGLLKKNLDTIKGLDVIDGIRTLKRHFDRIQNFLTDEYKIFIQKLPMVADPDRIEEQIFGLEKSIGQVIKKLQIAIRYQDDLSLVSAKIEQFTRALEGGSGTKNYKTLTQNIGQLECNFSDVRKGVDQFICNIDCDFNVEGIQMDIILKEPKKDICEIKKRLVAEMEMYIRKLKAVKAIGPGMEFIGEKKHLVSSSLSRIANIKGVDDGIDELKKVRWNVSGVCHIAEAIESLERAYHFQARTVFDFGSEVKGLMSVISKIVELRSHIKSYIEFLEKIKGVSETIEYYLSILDRLPSVRNIIHDLRFRIGQIIDGLEKIKTNVSEINTIKSELNIKKIKESIPKLSEKISVIEKSYGSIQVFVKQISLIHSNIQSLSVISNYVDRIGSFIKNSSSSLKGTGITYSKPESDSLKDFIKVLLRIKPEVDRISLNTIDPIKEKIQSITSEINDLEQKICSFMNSFLMCSNQSITQNTIDSTKRLLGIGKHISNDGLTKLGVHSQNVTNQKDENGFAWTLLSNMATVESKFVLSKLYDSVTKTDEALKKISWVENCQCIEYSKPGKCGLEFMRYIEKKFEYTEHKKHSKCVVDSQGNHLCICMVINYVLYPTLLQCLCHLIDMDFDTLSTISRKFEKYDTFSRYKLDVSRFLVFVVGVCMKISDWVYEKYAPVLGPCKSGNSICFCGCYGDVYYKYFISTMIYISYLVENMFGLDGSAIHHHVQQISLVNDHMYHDVSYYKRPKTMRPRNDSCICLCSSEHICGCAQRNSNSVCEVCKNCKIVCLSICLLCLMLKPFDSKDGCKTPKPCENQQGKCCICENKDTISSCLDNILCVSSSIQGACTGTLNSGGCEKICECIKQLPEDIKKIKTEFAKCFVDILKKICCNEETNAKSFSKCIDYSISRLWVSSSYYISKLISEMSYYGGVIRYAARWTEVFRKLHWDISYSIKDVLEPSRNNVILTKGNKMYYSINEISNKGFEGASNNHYSYNDAYRINTSRAHGSLILPVHYCTYCPRWSIISLLILLYY